MLAGIEERRQAISTSSLDLTASHSSEPEETPPSTETPSITNVTAAETTTPSAETTPAEVVPVAGPTPQEAFAALGMGAQTLRAIAEMGFGEPTPVQKQAIPFLLQGRDVIAQAPTGTGKTAAFGLPIIERLDENELAPQALIVVPTRELAIQVAEAMHSLGKFRELVTLPIYGGQPYERQLRALARGVQVVVGTPGRLLDHLRRKTLALGAIRTVVLDEADEMLNMGFIDDIEAILAELPPKHQSALFSATIPPRIAKLAEQFLHNAERVNIMNQREAVAPLVRQVYYEVPGHAKMDALSRILDLEEPSSAIVFVRTRKDADEVSEQLNGLGYLAQPIHGEVNQAQRERTLDRFRAGRTQLLVATDVAARGLDIPDVSHIINYDLPLDAESYVHRVGRTGRAGRNGQALTLVTPRERRQLRFIEQAIHLRLQLLRLPTLADVAARRRAAFRDDIMSILDGGQLDPFLALVEDLAGTREPAEIAAAAFKMAAQAREASRPSTGESWLESLTRPLSAEQPQQPQSMQQNQLPMVDDEERRRKRAEFAGDRRRPKSVRLFLRVGKVHGVRPAQLVGAIANEAGIPGEAIGDIDLYDTFSIVEVPEIDAENIITALNATTIRGQVVKATIAKPEDLPKRDNDSRDLRRRSDTSFNRGGNDPFSRSEPHRPFQPVRKGQRRPFPGSKAPRSMDRGPLITRERDGN